MKMIKFSRYVVLGAALAVVTGCNDAKLSTIDNGVYIAEAAPSNTFGQQIEAQLVDEGDVIKTLTVRLVRAINQDVTVTLDIDQQLIDEYNQQHEATYELLPEEFRSFDRTVTIPAGEVSAPVINLTIKPFTTPNNEAYAIPVRITSVTGPIGLVGNANHILYLLTSPNKQKAVVLKSANKTSLNFKNEIPVTQWTGSSSTIQRANRPEIGLVLPISLSDEIFSQTIRLLSLSMASYCVIGRMEQRRLRLVCSASWMVTILIVKNFGIRIHGIILLTLMTDLLSPSIKMVH